MKIFDVEEVSFLNFSIFLSKCKAGTVQMIEYEVFLNLINPNEYMYNEIFRHYKRQNADICFNNCKISRNTYNFFFLVVKKFLKLAAFAKPPPPQSAT